MPIKADKVLLKRGRILDPAIKEWDIITYNWTILFFESCCIPQKGAKMGDF